LDRSDLLPLDSFALAQDLNRHEMVAAILINSTSPTLGGRSHAITAAVAMKIDLTTLAEKVIVFSTERAQVMPRLGG
jgi:hypothetical protein